MTYYYLSTKEAPNSLVKNVSKKIADKIDASDSSDFESNAQGFIYSKQLNTLKPNSEIIESSSENVALPNLPPKSMADLLNRSYDFKVNNSCSVKMPSVAYWYGLSSFVIISPTRSNVFIDNENKANVILSSAAIAINNTSCLLPIFVNVQAPGRDMYIGICEGSALKTQFQVINFNYVPVQYAFLSGLLEIFKSKLVSLIQFDLWILSLIFMR